MNTNNRIRYFLAVAEARHFGHAAEMLHMRQPPLSQQVRLLERELGIELFTRTTRRVELTEAGRVLYEGAKRALDHLDEAIQRARRVQRGDAGLLRVAFVSTAASKLLSTVLRAFRERHPQVTIELFHLTSAQQARAFDARTIDVGFLRAPPHGDVEVDVIDCEPLFVALPETHPLARRRSIGMPSLRHLPFVMWDRQQTAGIAQSILSLCTRNGFQPAIALEVTSPPAMLSLVAGGVGIAIVPQSAMQLRPEAVAFRPLQERNAYSPMLLAWRRDHTPAMLPRFVSLVREVCHREANARRVRSGRASKNGRSTRRDRLKSNT